MAKINKIILLIILILVIIFISKPRKITPKGFFKISKKSRLKLIKKLEQECNSNDAMILTINYKEYLKDKKNALCWNNYYRLCMSREENNENLVIPIKCKKY